ncbi:MAG: CARDB domain-containing protein [Chitinophagaceae bacterium]
MKKIISILCLFSITLLSTAQKADTTYRSSHLPTTYAVPKPDLIITAFKIVSISPARTTYSYTVKNKGNAAVAMRQVAVQAFWDNDDSFTKPVAGCGRVISDIIGAKLEAGQSFTDTFLCSRNLLSYHLCMLVVDYQNQVAESNEGNNKMVIAR